MGCSRLETAKMLLDEYGSDIHHKDQYGASVIVRDGSRITKEMMQLLIDYGANVNDANNVSDYYDSSMDCVSYILAL